MGVSRLSIECSHLDCNAVFLPSALKPSSAEHVENEVGKEMERYHVKHSCLLTLVLSFANG